MKKILLFDNYDSFTYNLLHTVRSLGHTDVDVIRNNRMTLEEVERYDKIILSPGPGLPEEAGLLLPLIERYATSKSILGVCLGHQAIGQVFGAKLENIPFVFHGVQTPVQIVADDYLFTGLPEEIAVGRYHSWIVGHENFPVELEVTALDREEPSWPCDTARSTCGAIPSRVNSHPGGTAIIRNFLNHPVLSRSKSE